jgi:ABC-type multidrug transport system permease subunit
VQNTAGVLFEWGAIIFIGQLNAIAVFPRERDVFLRERHDATYSAFAFLASYMSIEVPFSIACAFVFALVMAFCVGLDRSFTTLALWTLCATCAISVGESVAIMFCACFRHVGFALSVVSVNLSSMNVMSGFLSVDMPRALDIINRASPIHYMAQIIANAQFHGKTYGCGDASAASCIDNGAAALQRYHFSDCGDCHREIALMLTTTVAFRVVAFVFLAFRAPYLKE